VGSNQGVLAAGSQLAADVVGYDAPVGQKGQGPGDVVGPEGAGYTADVVVVDLDGRGQRLVLQRLVGFDGYHIIAGRNIRLYHRTSPVGWVISEEERPQKSFALLLPGFILLQTFTTRPRLANRQRALSTHTSWPILRSTFNPPQLLLKPLFLLPRLALQPFSNRLPLVICISNHRSDMWPKGYCG